MRKAGLVAAIVLGLLAFGAGFAGTTAALDIMRPSVAGSPATVNFVVNSGDTTAQVAQDLEKAGLVRNAVLFRLMARYRKLDRGIEPGVYRLSPSMTGDQIIQVLQRATPDQLLAGVPPGLRVTQYAPYFKALKNFNADTFLKIAKTGMASNGTPLWQTYWYVAKPGPNVAYALEGYLFPDTYYFDPAANTDTVVTTLLNGLGERLCPGPADHPTAYIMDQAQCKAHAITVGGNTNIFTAMEQRYYTTNDAQALNDTLNIGALVAREIANLSDAPGVAGVYYARYAALEHGAPNPGGVANLGSDPSAQYARDTDNPPTNGKWWADLADKGENVDPKSPYNVYTNGGHLPPGPIAAPIMAEITAAADPPQTQYFYFLSDHCGNIHYAKTNDAFNVIVGKYITQNQCSTSVT